MRARPVYPFLHEFERSRYSPLYLRSGVLEAQVQTAVVAALSLRWRAKVTPVDVGDKRLRGRLARLGVDRRALNQTGGSMERGVVDLAVTFPGGRAGWLEVKKPARYGVSKRTGQLVQESPAGAPTEEQLEFLAAQHRLGAVVGVLWSETDLEACVTEAA